MGLWSNINFYFGPYHILQNDLHSRVGEEEWKGEWERTGAHQK